VEDVREVTYVFASTRTEGIEPGAVAVVPGASEVDHGRELPNVLVRRSRHDPVPPLPRGERPNERVAPVARGERVFVEEVDGPGPARKNARTCATVNDETARRDARLLSP
jgi:hypothetical protein